MRACDGRTPQRGASKHNAIIAAAGPLRETGLDQLFFEGLFAPRRPQIAEGLLVRGLPIAGQAELTRDEVRKRYLHAALAVASIGHLLDVHNIGQALEPGGVLLS